MIDRAIFGGDHLALFGDANAALHRALGLRLDCAKRRSATTPDRSAASVEQLHRDSGLGKDWRKRARCLEQFPCRGQITAILVGIGVADHHFLMAARLRERTHRQQREKCLHGRGRGLQIGDGFEQRYRHDAGRRRAVVGDAVEARLFEQHIDLEHVGHAFGLADIVRRDRRFAEVGLRLCSGADDRKFLCGFCAVDIPFAGERAVMRKFGNQQLDAGGFVQRGIIAFNPGHFQKLRHHAFVDVAVLPQVERCQMKAENLDRADQATERPAARQCAVAVAGERRRNRHQIGAQFFGRDIGIARQFCRTRRVVADQLDMRRTEPRVNPGHRAAIRLVGARGCIVAAFLGKHQHRFGRRAHQRRNRNLRTQFMHRLQIAADRGAAIATDCILQRTCINKRITIAVTAYPCAEPDKARRTRTQCFFPTRIELGQSVKKHVLHSCTGILDFIGDE